MARALILPALLLVASFGASASHRATPASITGTVRDPADSTPLVGARVFVEAVGDSVSTDAEGRFNLRLPDTGRVTLRVERTGYRSLRLPETQVVTDTLKLRVELHSEVPRLLFVTAPRNLWVWRVSRDTLLAVVVPPPINMREPNPAIDRIDVVKGIAAVNMYGQMGAGGVIRVVNTGVKDLLFPPR